MDTTKQLIDILRNHGADDLADAVENCECGPLQLEVYERTDAGVFVSRHNIHADIADAFRNADVDGLAFKIIP
jgi:hypothetical protein